MSYLGNTPTTQSFIPQVDYFSGNGSTTAFTLSRPVASSAQILVFVANVPQNPNSAFSVSGSTLTFTSAPPSGTNNIWVEYVSTITQTIQPGAGTVIPTTLSSGGPSWDTSGNLTASGSVSDSIGNVRTLVQNSQTASYVLAATDNGKHISITTGGVTVPQSIFSAGQNVVIYNNSGSSQTITQGTGVTLYFGNDGTTGNRTLGLRGLCTVLCVASNTFVITGAGLT